MVKKSKVDNKNVIHVAVAVILGDDGRVLLAKRPEEKHMGGLWEFPGGKVAPGEDIKAALNRELGEELGIEVATFLPLIKIRHDYPDKSVLLDTWVVSGIRGEPTGNEGQLIQWVEKDCLDNYGFPEANKAILKALQLPDRYMITGDFVDQKALFNGVSTALENGIRLIQFRAHWLAKRDYLQLAQALAGFVQTAGGTLIIKGDASLLSECWCHGLHLTSRQLGSGIKPEKQHPRQLLAASCHDQEQIAAAEAMGVDFITLSPVKATASHSGAIPLGLDRAEILTAVAKVPVFWLGGMNQEDTHLARRSGARGIAAIQAFWG